MGYGTYTDILQHFDEISKGMNPAYLFIIKVFIIKVPVKENSFA